MRWAAALLVGLTLIGSAWMVTVGFAYVPSAMPPPALDATAATPDRFPRELACADLEPGPGPDWGELVIGRSTLGDLVDTYQDHYEIRIKREGDTTNLALIVNLADGGMADHRFRLCVRDDVIYAIDGWPLPVDPGEIAIHTEMVAGPPPATIYDDVNDYGVPDAVAFAPDPAQRVVFWFEEGYAAVTSVTLDENPFIGFGVVESRVYFPYQPSEGYESRWPFSRTPREWTGSSTEYYPSDQNPFDFDAIAATLTAQPPQTATPRPANGQ